MVRRNAKKETHHKDVAGSEIEVEHPWNMREGLRERGIVHKC